MKNTILTISAVMALAFAAAAPSYATAYSESAHQPLKVSKQTCDMVQRIYDQHGPQALRPNEGDLLDKCHASPQHSEQASAPAEYKPGHFTPIHVKKNGVEFKRSRDGFAYINGSLAAKDEDNADATAYSAGLITVIVYKKTGKINAMEDGKLLGRLK